MLSCFEKMPTAEESDDAAIPGGAHFALSPSDFLELEDLPVPQRRLVK